MIFHISSLHTKDNGNGSLNIQHCLISVKAESREEAITKYLNATMIKFPKHELFSTPLVIAEGSPEEEIDRQFLNFIECKQVGAA